MLKRILFAHDATPAAEKVLPYLEHLARLEEAEVFVLHVYEQPERYMATQGYEPFMERLESLAQEVVDDTCDHLQKAGISVRGLVRSGDPARAILETVREENISLIVLASRGPSSVKDLLLGEVSTEVVRYAHCPVFLVP
ncbi:MAG: universal stress protein [Anaerolineales bacterium]